MDKRQSVWEHEHATFAALPSHDREEPGQFVVSFADYLKKRGISPPIKCIDIGCGKGRNSIYLARQGFEVYGMDFVKLAVGTAAARAQKSGVAENLISI